MKFLLDTHTLLWTMNGSPELSPVAREAIRNLDHPIFVSVVSIWEAGTKYRLGKLPQAYRLIHSTQQVLTALSCQILPLELEHARFGGVFPHPHRDPFDRMLAAQAILSGLTLLSADPVFDSMHVQRLW